MTRATSSFPPGESMSSVSPPAPETGNEAVVAKVAELIQVASKLLEAANTQTQQNAATLRAMEALVKTGKCAEMRQCQTSGESTDAARMLGLYLRGHSALWSKANKAVCVEIPYDKGDASA